MKNLLYVVALFLIPCRVLFAADAVGKPTLPADRPLRVAFVISAYATVIDFAGPWEVFQDTDTGDKPGIQLYTVAPTKGSIWTSGNHGHGLSIAPDYSFADAPEPDIVIVGAQTGGDGLNAWLQKMHKDNKVIMSVCTGAFKVAAAGLLDGRQATTHHDFFDKFAASYPTIHVVRTSRYVQSDSNVFTAGGLTSGIDLALHLVVLYYGEATAQQTADYMEYQGDAWKTNRRVAQGSPQP